MDESTPPQRPLGVRDFRLLLVGQTISRLGTTVSLLAMPLVAISVLHAGPVEVAVLSAMGWVPWLVFGLFAGVGADRYPPRQIMILTDVVSGIALLSVPVSAWWLRLTLVQLLVVALVTGTAAAFFGAARQVYLPLIVRPDGLVPANALLQGTDSAASLAGPALAGVLAQAASAVLGVLLDAASFLVSAVLLLRTGRTPARDQPRPGSGTVRKDIGEGLRFLAGDSLLRTMTVVAAASNLVFAAGWSLAVLFTVEVVDLPPFAAGVVFATGGLGGVLGSLIATRLMRATGTARATLLGIWLTFPLGLVFPFGSDGAGIVLLVLGYMVPGIGVAVCHIGLSVLRQTYCPPEVLGRVVATMQVVFVGAVPFGALLGGALGELFGVRGGLVVAMALLLVPAVILLLSPVRGMRDFPTRSQAATEPGEAPRQPAG